MLRQEIITRRQLPHWYKPGAAHFVTFRLAGSLPRSLIEQLTAKKEILLQRPLRGGISPAQHRQRVHKQIFQMYDTFLDQQRDVDWLADARIAALVRSSLYFLDGDKYGLHAYTILPNHVHMLIQPFETAAHEFEEIVGEGADKRGPLSSIMHSLKGYTAHEANQIMRRRGTFWQHESYDHWVRDDAELERIVAYINANPRKAGLATRPQHWFWSSAHDRYLADGDTSGWLNWDA